MEPVKPVEHSLVGTESPEQPENQQVKAVQRLLNLVDKTFRTARAYGKANQLSQKFINQLYDELTAHLEGHGTLGVVVQRFEFYYQGKVVYQKATPSENLAFKLYAEGIRELSFSRGISKEDLTHFLESLGADYDLEGDEEEDIVTRLWDKGLSTVSIVTAEEIMAKSGSTDPLAPQDALTLNRPVSHLKDITAEELANQKREQAADAAGRDVRSGVTTAGETTDGHELIDRDFEEAAQSSVEGVSEGSTGTGTASIVESARQAKGQSDRSQVAGKSYFRANLPRYEVSPEEMNQLAVQLRTESVRDDTAYVLDMMRAMLASEKSPVLLTELLDLCGEILKNMAEVGNWKHLNTIVGVFRETKRRKDLTKEHQEKLSQLLDSLADPKTIEDIAQLLNLSTQIGTYELSGFLQNFKPTAVPSLCVLLGKLKVKHHRLTLCDALTTLAKDTPELLTQGLTDSRWFYVRNLVYVIGKLGNPRLADAVLPLTAHQDKEVRKEALRTLEILRPSGSDNRLFSLLNDSDKSVRLEALNLLKVGQYRTGFSTWAPIVGHEQFLRQSSAELRACFEVMGQTARDEAVPYLQQLVTQRLWPHRKMRQEIGTLAAEALGKIGSPAALAALATGQKRFNRVIREACASTLEALMNRRKINR
ncbi:MAG: HEAT repeat domain-containing protein [Nitrospirales bacterium]